jgi:hypothetical protein
MATTITNYEGTTWEKVSYWHEWWDGYGWIACWSWGSWEAVWYQAWYWVDTSHYEWLPQNVFVPSGYWEDYLAWISSGYYLDPLHGTVTVTKEPAYVFTRWHWLTPDGRRQSEASDRAHADMTLSWQTDRPVAAIREYVDVRRDDETGAVDRILICNIRLDPPEQIGSRPARVEYEHAGLGTHYFILTATDGTTAVIYCEIPINGYRSVNTGEETRNENRNGFARSAQDTGSITF